jgi:hypothetical protein
MGITAHYIDPDEVAMKYQLICFPHLPEDHSGENIAIAMDKALCKLELPWDKVNCLLI